MNVHCILLAQYVIYAVADLRPRMVCNSLFFIQFCEENISGRPLVGESLDPPVLCSPLMLNVNRALNGSTSFQ